MDVNDKVIKQEEIYDILVQEEVFLDDDYEPKIEIEDNLTESDTGYNVCKNKNIKEGSLQRSSFVQPIRLERICSKDLIMTIKSENSNKIR